MFVVLFVCLGGCCFYTQSCVPWIYLQALTVTSWEILIRHPNILIPSTLPATLFFENEHVSLITTRKWSEWSGQGTGWAKNNATEASDGTNSSVKIKSVMFFCFLIMITLHIFKMEDSIVVSFLSGIKPTPWLLSVTQLIFFTHNWLKLVWLLRSHEEVYYLQHKQMHLQIKICHHFLIKSFVSCQSFIYTWVREW